MNLSPAAPLNSSRPFSGTYYRAVNTQHIHTAVSTTHTPTVVSRFSDGSQGYRLLYLASDHQTALLEVQAMVGKPWSSSPLLPTPSGSWAVVPVTFDLRHVADLTDVATQTVFGTNYQEITGDWEGYTLRSLYAAPVFGTAKAIAPTQALGQYLYHNGFDGLITVSAKIPYARNVVVFPDNLSRSGGAYNYIDPITNTSVVVTS